MNFAERRENLGWKFYFIGKKSPLYIHREKKIEISLHICSLPQFQVITDTQVFTDTQVSTNILVSTDTEVSKYNIVMFQVYKQFKNIKFQFFKTQIYQT